MNELIQLFLNAEETENDSELIRGLFSKLLSIKFTSDFTSFPATEQQLDRMYNSIEDDVKKMQDIDDLITEVFDAPSCTTYKSNVNFI